MDNNTRRYANNDWCYEQCRRRMCRGIYHMIQQGDTLYSLSRQYKVSVDAIMRANPGVNIYNLHINDELCIPVMMNNRPMPVPGMPMNNMPMNNMPMNNMPMNNMPMNNMPMNGMPMNGMPMNNNMPLDFTFEYMEDDINNNRQGEFTMFDDERVETESHKQANYFSENDSVKDMLAKTGMSMDELLDCINRR